MAQPSNYDVLLLLFWPNWTNIQSEGMESPLNSAVYLLNYSYPVSTFMHMQVRSERRAGNLANAHKYSRRAYVWAKCALTVGIILTFTAGAIVGIFVMGILACFIWLVNL